MKVTVEMNEEQAIVFKKAMELYGRIGMGQLHDLTFHPAFMERNFEGDYVEKVVDDLKAAVFTDLHGRGHSYGIRSESTPEESKVAYDLYQVVRNRMAWAKNPNGNSWTVDYDAPTQFGKQPLAECEVKDAVPIQKRN